MPEASPPDPLSKSREGKFWLSASPEDQHAQDEELHPKDRSAACGGGSAAGVQKGGRLSLDVPVSGEGGLPHYARRGAP